MFEINKQYIDKKLKNIVICKAISSDGFKIFLEFIKVSPSSTREIGDCVMIYNNNFPCWEEYKAPISRTQYWTLVKSRCDPSIVDLVVTCRPFVDNDYHYAIAKKEVTLTEGEGMK